MSADVLGTLLLCVTFTASAGFKVVGPDGPVVGVVGEDLVLPCSLKPPTSAVDMDVVWLIGGDIVHHYKREHSHVEKQLPAYRDRTRLDREELQRGNVSLKISSVRLSDANTYRCYISAQSGTDEAPVAVSVEAVGSAPVVSTESLFDGRVTLQCDSEGWSSEPRVDWRDSRGRSLPAEATSVQQTTEGFLRVSKRVTVQESDDNSFLCRVSSQRQTKLQEVKVPSHQFARSRHHWASLGSLLLFFSVCVFAYSRHTDIQPYKQWVISSFTWANDDSHLPGKNIKTYTEPLIIHSLRGTDKSQKNNQRITLDQLFNPDNDGPPPKVVILQGHSGYGKSITTRKIICDWAAGKRFTKKFDLVVLLKCEVLDMEGEWRSLLELISCPRKSKPVMESILNDAPHKVLFIIDGFDKLKKSAPKPSSHLPNQPFTRAPPADTLQALLSGRILPESFLLVTTRHTAADMLREILRQQEQRNIEILGFNESIFKKYLEKFFENQESADQAYCCVQRNNFLLSSCRIPMRCWMICSVMNEKENHQRVLELETRSSMYVMFVGIILRDTGMEKGEDLRKLAKLAKEGTWKNKFLFDNKGVSDLKYRSPLLQKIRTRQQVMYSFVHQSVQEFFAALYYITLEDAEVQREVKTLLDSVTGPFGDKNIHLLPVICFLFGLSNATVWRSLEVSLNYFIQYSSSPAHNPTRELLEKWILVKVKEFIKKDVKLFSLHCLFELHEEMFVKKAMEEWNKVHLSSFPLKWEDYLALHYCLQCRPKIGPLRLSSCKLTAEKLKLLAPALAELSCKELWLDVEKISDPDDVGDLVSALGTERILRRLRVKNSHLSEESMEKILKALSKQTTVYSVHLSVKTINSHTAQTLLNYVQMAKASDTMSVRLSQDGHWSGDHLCSHLCVETDLHAFTVCVENDGSATEPPLRQLSVSIPEEKVKEVNTSHWTALLQRVQRLRERRSTLEGDVEELLDCLQALPCGRVNMTASIYAIQYPTKVMSLMHYCARLQEFDVTVRKLLRYEETICSFLSVRREQNSSLRLSVGQHAFWMSSGEIQKSRHVSRLRPLSLVSLMLPTEVVLSLGWERFLEAIANLNRGADARGKDALDLTACSTHSADAPDDDLDALFSLLRSVSGLREVELRVDSLTDTWAQHILSLIRDKEINERTVNVLTDWESKEESLCSSLCLTKKISSFRFSAEHLSQGSSVPTLSYISILADSHSETQLDWIDYLRKFHTLKNEMKDLYVYEYVGPLLSLLHSLSGLREVELRVSCLTASWARLIVTLINSRSTLQEVRLSAGLSFSQSAWTECGTLLLEGITYLKQSLKQHPDFTITLTGIKRRTSEVSCHYREGRLQCNRPVKITIRGETYSEEPLDQWAG